MYGKLAGLQFDLESYELEPLQQEVPGGYVRRSTTVRLRGGGEEGMGEDVTYGGDNQLSFQKHGTSFKLDGSYTLDSFSAKVAGLDLFHEKLVPPFEVYRRYRRWAFESAALSLALKQHHTTLAAVLDIKPQPVHFVCSPSLGKPANAKRVKELLALNSALTFKLDLTTDWTDELLATLAATKAIVTLDLKGYYQGTVVEVKTDPALYKKVIEAFPEAVIEDPDITSETTAMLEAHQDRVSWDAPIHTVADLAARPFPVKMLNIKPSRFGSLKELFEVYDYCSEQNITMYGGGQFELGVGRQQIQYLASLFHPQAPNDVAPAVYNLAQLPASLPPSPLDAATF